MDRLQAAEQFRKALQIFAEGLEEGQVLQIPAVFDSYKVGKAYQCGEYFIYGENSVGDPQLYKVLQAHTSQENWKPNETSSLYTAIGISSDGYPMWAHPAGSHDAYNIGDQVEHNGKRWSSTVDNNVWEPGVYGWKEEEK